MRETYREKSLVILAFVEELQNVPFRVKDDYAADDLFLDSKNIEVHMDSTYNQRIGLKYGYNISNYT